MDFRSALLVAFVSILELTPAMTITYHEDLSFKKKLMVNNRTVTCSGTTTESKYNFRMYTCTDIRVDGLKLFHGNNDYKVGTDKSPNYNGCPGCPCGSYTHEPNDVLSLCSAMLSAESISGNIIAAYTPDPICIQTKSEKRIKYYLADGEPQWLEVVAFNGYLSRLQCSVTA